MPARGDKRLTILRRAVGRPAVTLICVPFAGGNPEVFCPWAQWLDPGIDLLAVRLPGHGPRMREAPFATWGELVDDTMDALAPFLSRPHAFYGHCFGGRLAYELAHRAHTAMTARLFIAACRSPDTPSADARVYELPDADFCSALATMGMAPAEVLGNAALMRILLPGIRSQIRLAERWGDRRDAIVDVPITAMYGQEDLTSERQGMTGWPGFTTRGCEFVEIPGGHFFLQANPPLLGDIINSRLAVTPAAPDPPSDGVALAATDRNRVRQASRLLCSCTPLASMEHWRALGSRGTIFSLADQRERGWFTTIPQ